MYVIGTVADVTRAELTSRSEVRVERLMVEEPTTTTSEEVFRVDEDFDVLMEVVTVEPAELVLVMTTADVCVGASEVCAALDAVLSADELAAVGSALDEAGVDAALLAGTLLAEDMVDAGAVLEACEVADEVAPVPTACLLFGIMPSGMMSARICAKPRNNESIVALIIFLAPSSADWTSETPDPFWHATVELNVEICRRF